ncbi:MAG TPA: hypothetical protein VIC53_00670 [Wenzhouxiangella sp.]
MHFNLLPWRARRDRRRQHRFFGLVMALGVLIGATQLWVLSHLQATAEQQAAEVAKQQAQLAEYEAALNLTRTKKEQAQVTDDEMREARQALDALQLASEPVGEWLLDLMIMRPTGVWIESLRVVRMGAVSEAEGMDDSSFGSRDWMVGLSGQAVLDTDALRYQEALAERFGRRDQRHDQQDVFPWGTADGWLDDVESHSIDPLKHPGLEPFAIEQWVRVETP